MLGVILYAVGGEKTLEHPDEPLSAAGRWALGLGIAFTLADVAVVRYRAIRGVAWERLAGAAVGIAAVVVLRDLDAVWLTATAVGVLVATLTVEMARLSKSRSVLHGRE